MAFQSHRTVSVTPKAHRCRLVSNLPNNELSDLRVIPGKTKAFEALPYQQYKM